MKSAAKKAGTNWEVSKVQMITNASLNPPISPIMSRTVYTLRSKFWVLGDSLNRTLNTGNNSFFV